MNGGLCMENQELRQLQEYHQNLGLAKEKPSLLSFSKNRGGRRALFCVTLGAPAQRELWKMR